MTQRPLNVRDLTDSHWEVLVSRVKSGNCTPILGAGASHPPLPLGAELAQKLADRFNYPFAPKLEKNAQEEPPNPPTRALDLAEVAQYIAIDHEDNTFPKDVLSKWFREIPPPDFDSPDSPHGILASLDLPIYITTNYDDYMYQALKRQGKSPEHAMCVWDSQIDSEWSIFTRQPDYRPTPENPVVFHLHGHIDIPESMVLTEDDYLDFLVAISKNDRLLPAEIVGKMAKSSLLVIGYGLKDWNFRVLLRGIMANVRRSQQRLNVTLQFPPDEPADARIDYLTRYYSQGYYLTACFDTINDFVKQLGEKCKQSVDELET